METGNMYYYSPGDIVRVRHNIDFVPDMWVVEKITRNVKNTNTGDIDTMFIGIKCRWFNSKGELQEGVFNTKDLELVKNV